MSIDDEWQPPRCSHGRIILGCPHDDCPEQNAYIAEMYALLENLYVRQRDEARRIVRSILRGDE